jgi:hypothetical protein
MVPYVVDMKNVQDCSWQKRSYIDDIGHLQPESAPLPVLLRMGGFRFNKFNKYGMLGGF